MPAQKKDALDALKDRVSRYREIKLTVTGRKSGRPLSRPVWFVYEEPTTSTAPGTRVGYGVVQERAP